MREDYKKVISISRRLEMVGFFPDKIVEILRHRCLPERTHSLVFWSKNPANLLQHRELRETIKRYDQIFLHLTITGLGGTALEPGIPTPHEVEILLPELIGLIGSPERVRLRFDPILHLTDPGGRFISNLDYFTRVVQLAGKHAIESIIISWCTLYPKVIKRLARLGWKAVPIHQDRKEEELTWLRENAAAGGVILHGCCEEALPISSCIDGKLLSGLHPKGVTANPEHASGQRPGCGCTKSWDIGWYYSCPGGCLYCYGRPSVE